MGFISGCVLTIGIKDMRTGEWKSGGYLVCKKCNGYYESQPNESPDDFTDKCECGGELKYVEKIDNE
jgi:heat shock protein HtpX